jgi:hypothetical protein
LDERKKAVVLIDVHSGGNGKLAQITFANDGMRHCARTTKNRYDHGRQNADDGDNNKQLNESEPMG